MAILVTGGAGYIGTHTCIELLQSGHEVIVIDNFSNSKPEALKRVTKITGRKMKIYHVDLLNKMDLNQVFIENNVEAVIHLAGLKSVGESTLIPLRYYENNIAGTVNLCNTMRKYSVKKLVFSSSATVYGSVSNKPIHEEMPLAAVTPYGRSKLVIEEMLQDLEASDPMWHIAILRYFNPIGAHESGQIGEDPVGIPNNLLPYISQVAIREIRQLNIFGNDYPTKDGTGVRDYIHVVDLAKGHLAALEKISSVPGIDAFNLGTGKGYSVFDMIQAFEKASQTSIPYKVVERRQGDVAICFADTTKAKEQLHWQATKEINDMCADTWRWQQQNPHGYEGVKETSMASQH